MTNNNNNKRENEMTNEFDHFDTQIQSDELITDADLYEAEAFMDTLEDEINVELDAIQNELDYHNLDEYADAQNCFDDQRDHDFYTS